MAEHLGSNSEVNERAGEIAEVGAERLERLARENAEHGEGTEHAEKRAEHARKIIERQEPEPEQAAAEETAHKPSPGVKIPFINHHLNYKQTLGSIQRQLTPVSRNFSKFIHTPAVEKVSEALENTVARPSVMVGTIWTALIVGSIFYLIAYHYGYALSGSELLFSFVIGALFGLVIEGVIHLLRRR
ncbi:MAG TPA: hypothetical protein VHQ86_06520 [Candidatus Saccharimonadia bacterium]|jgi:hypothetical protein|nr:hypothetical protein [Candidatus Saccharimonadia bacterium]